MSLSFLPTLNAMLNATSGTFLVLGYLMIRRKKIGAHRFCMIAATSASILFLISYIYYHYHVGATSFKGEGMARPVYFTILITHTVMAVTAVPFVVVTLRRAFRGRFIEHQRVARWTFPMWLYVSITGVIVYLMLYHIYPSR